ncbi:MAG TPA: MFS transporter [Nitrososphaerales archaeon]|nr:MFS transporter [Nitrososphaerales archaeon]
MVDQIAPPPSAEGDRNFRLLLYARVLRSVGISFSSVALPLYMAALGFSVVVIGVSFLLMTVFGSLLVFLWGPLGDRYGYARVMMAVEALFVVSALVFSLSPSGILPIILFAAVIGGYGGMGGGGLRGAFGPGMTALVGYLWRGSDERVRRLGTITFVAGLAGTAGYALLSAQSALSVFFGDVGAFRAFYVLTAVTGLGAIVLISLIREPRHARKKERVITREGGRFVSRIVLSNVVNGAGIGLAIPLLPLWFRLAFGYSNAEISVIYVASAVVGAVASYFAHEVSSRFGAVLSASAARVTNGLLLVSMAFAPLGILAASLYCLRAVSAGVSAPIRQAVTMGGVQDSELGTATSLTGLAQRASFASSGLGGYLLTLSEGLPLEFGGVLQVCGGALFYGLLRRSRGQEASRP